VSPLERRYRRMLRLLPAGYRQTWEEDMVSAFLQGADGASRPPLGERLSVLALAARLWLTGSHASPRGLVWYQTVRTLALLVLLHQAVTASVGLAREATMLATNPQIYPLSDANILAVSGRTTVRLTWIVAFVCLAIGRLVAARLLVTSAAIAGIGFSLALSAASPYADSPFLAAAVGTLVPWVWLVISVVAVLLIPAGIHAPDRRLRWLWLGAYLVAAPVLAAHHVYHLLTISPDLVRRYLDLAPAAHIGLLVVIAAALLWAAIGGPHPAWLLALAALGGIDAWLHLREPVETRTLFVGFQVPEPAVDFEPLLAVLALVCAVVGVLALRRLPRAVPGPV
jgi:hypothetical protein